MNSVTCFTGLPFTEKLSTALSTLQSKFIEQVQELKKQHYLLMEALKEEKLRCETLERELTSQKNCIDLILEEAKPKQSKQCSKGKHTDITESNEIGNLKSEVGSLKSKVKILVEQAEAKNLDSRGPYGQNRHFSASRFMA